METNWAAEHLQTIRTLMERSAVYRRALAPILTFNGVLGAVGALAGSLLKIESAHSFVLFWGAVAAVALSGSFFLVRRQALKDSEPFWSPPTTRVAQAMLPPLGIGMLIGLIVVIESWKDDQAAPDFLIMITIGWMWLYGCALHSAGFFMQRSIKLLGWIFIGAGFACLLLTTRPAWLSISPHVAMGIGFGGLHLMAGIYFFFTEKRRNET
jgi:hypothetical protein